MEEITMLDLLNTVEIKVDNTSHIDIKNQKKCKNKCPDKPCTFICPSKVYYWDKDQESMGIEYGRCIECGACILACPQANIDWEYPRAGFGVSHRF